MDKKLFRIVLTGGPCAGKTSSLALIYEKFTALGFNVITVHEIATLFYEAGIRFNRENLSLLLETYKNLLNYQIFTEETFLNIARSCDKPSIIIYDRGVMDVSAYLSKEEWKGIIEELSLSAMTLRDTRYDYVFHLVTAANGAEQFYNHKNNARKENIEEARALDIKIMEAWVGHPHLRVINNSGLHEEKKNKVLTEISSIVDSPKPIVAKRKFLVSYATEIPLRYESFDIYQTYLKSDKERELRLRKRGQNGLFIYIYSEKSEPINGQSIETARIIGEPEYTLLLENPDRTRITIHKRRDCFIWRDLYFELDTFIDPHCGMAILIIEHLNDTLPVIIPDFIKIGKEITNDSNYYNYALSLAGE